MISFRRPLRVCSATNLVNMIGTKIFVKYENKWGTLVEGVDDKYQIIQFPRVLLKTILVGKKSHQARAKNNFKPPLMLGREWPKHERDSGPVTLI